MTDWSRRSVLEVLGMAPLLPACGAALRGGRGKAVPESLAATRVRLREFVAAMQTRFPYAAALAQVRRRDRAVADRAESRIDRTAQMTVVFTVADESGVVTERSTNDLSSDGIVGAAADLLGDRKADIDFGSAREYAIAGPAVARSGGGWLDRARGLYERSRRHGGSPVVYRGAYFDVDDTESVFVSEGRDVSQRVVRLREGVAFVAAAGATTYTDTAERAGTIDTGKTRISDDALAAAADGALALLTARATPSGEFDVVFDPGATALWVGHCVAPALVSDRWLAGDSAAPRLLDEQVGSELVHVVDDPTLDGGYGSYRFDDEGRAAETVRLIDAGALRRPLTDRAGAAELGASRTANGRRDTGTAPARPAPSNIYFGGGAAADRDALIAGVEDGMLLENALAARSDPSSWTALLRIARARQIKKGKLTGRLYGPVLLRGHVPSMLASVAGATKSVRHRPIGPGVSAGGPFLLLRAQMTGA